MQLLRRPYINHLLIWMSYFILLFWFYSETSRFEPSLLKSLFIVILQAGVFYLNLYLLLPQYFEKKQYSKYGFYIFLILIASLVLFYLFDQVSLRFEYHHAVRSNDWSHFPRGFGRRGHHPGPPHWYNPFQFAFMWRQILFHGFFIVIVLFISTIYRNVKVSGQKEKESLELKSRITEAESNMLKSQINPHFLFNTLNNIYSMAQLKSDQTPEAVHRLSEMLRYVIYDCSRDRVSLGQEVRYLKSYIELNMMKEENMDNVHYELDDIDGTLPIAPMILVPFIENSFKHTKIEDRENSWITIQLKTHGKQLQFEVSNTIPEMTHRKDKSSGIGLDNVKKRLQLIYPEQHYLHISDKGGIFKVELTIDLDEHKMSDR